MVQMTVASLVIITLLLQLIFPPLLPVLYIDHFSMAVICGTAAEATTRLAEETHAIFSWNTLFVHVKLVRAPSFLDGLLKRTWQ